VYKEIIEHLQNESVSVKLDLNQEKQVRRFQLSEFKVHEKNLQTLNSLPTSAKSKLPKVLYINKNKKKPSQKLTQKQPDKKQKFEIKKPKKKDVIWL